MTYHYVWITIALSQLALLGFTAVLLWVNRDRQSSADILPRVEHGLMHAEDAVVNANDGGIAALDVAAAESMLAALRGVTGGEAWQDAIETAIARVEGAERERLVAMMRDEPWISQALGDASSRFWWRRLAATRLLTLVGDQRDRAAIRKLIADSHPAVQSAATECLLRYADEELVAQVLDGLSARTAAVQAHQIGVLRRTPGITIPLILRRIRADAPPAKLNTYIDVARALNSRECFDRVVSLSIHQNPEVRVAVARALRDATDETSVIKLLSLLRDSDWRVRAQAARGLGVVHDERAVKELVRAMTDPAWWVRFRAGLSLAMMGDAGRGALDEARSLPDRFCRDMAVFVSGLSEASIAELAADA